MLNQETFKEIVAGIAHPETTEEYYYHILHLLKNGEGLTSEDLQTAVLQRQWLEQNCFTEELPESEPEEKEETDSQAILDFLDKLIDRDLPIDEALAVLNFQAHDLKIYPRQLIDLYHERKRTLEEESIRSEIEGELDDILKLYKKDINLSHYLPPYLSDGLTRYCENNQLRQSVALTAFLSAVSVCHKVGTRVLVDPSKNWAEPPGLFSLFISPSGQGKTPVLNAIIQRPFWEIQNQWVQNWEVDMEDYERELEEIKNLPKEDKAAAMSNISKPPTQPRLIFASDPTLIGINCQFQAHPSQGLLGLYDEARKLFAFDRGGSQVSDRSDLLSYYNGTGQVELRRDGVRCNQGEALLSIFGAIQPDILLEIMSVDDADGQWARFLMVCQPLQKKQPSRNCSEVNIQELMVWTYESLLTNSRKMYQFSGRAGEIFDQYLYDEIEKKRLLSPSPSLAALYGKAGGKVARIALSLHALKQLDAKMGEFSDVIEEKTVQEAIFLNEFYLTQTKILYSQAQALCGDLPPKLASIVELSKQVGEVSSRIVARYRRSFRKESPDSIRAYFKQLEKLGKGRLTGHGNRLKFLAF